METFLETHEWRTERYMCPILMISFCVSLLSFYIPGLPFIPQISHIQYLSWQWGRSYVVCLVNEFQHRFQTQAKEPIIGRDGNKHFILSSTITLAHSENPIPSFYWMSTSYTPVIELCWWGFKDVRQWRPGPFTNQFSESGLITTPSKSKSPHVQKRMMPTL